MMPNLRSCCRRYNVLMSEKYNILLLPGGLFLKLDEKKIVIRNLIFTIMSQSVFIFAEVI